MDIICLNSNRFVDSVFNRIVKPSGWQVRLKTEPTSTARQWRRKIEADQTNFAPGTHLKVKLGVYEHHGIACGDGNVVHFGRGIFDIDNAVIEQVDLETFSQSRPIVVVDSKIEFPPEEVVRRATSRLGERSYDLWSNNCEHFANWSRSGDHSSPQIDVTETIARQTAAIAAKPILKKMATSAATRGGLVGSIAKGPTIVAGVADAVQATAEIVATKQGKTKEQTRQIGRQAGAASSIAIGWMVGGPVTAAAGVGIWFVGQMMADQVVDVGKEVVDSFVKQSDSSSSSSSSKLN